MEKFREIAEGLILAVEGIASEANIRGVIEVFAGIEHGVNLKWEDHLASETGELLMYDEVLCKCGRLIEIKRDVTAIYTKETQ